METAIRRDIASSARRLEARLSQLAEALASGNPGGPLPPPPPPPPTAAGEKRRGDVGAGPRASDSDASLSAGAGRAGRGGAGGPARPRLLEARLDGWAGEHREVVDGEECGLDAGRAVGSGGSSGALVLRGATREDPSPPPRAADGQRGEEGTLARRPGSAEWAETAGHTGGRREMGAELEHVDPSPDSAKLHELGAKLEHMDKTLEHVALAVGVRTGLGAGDDGEDRRRLKEKLKAALERDKRARIREVVSEREVWLEYVFGICKPDQRIGRRGSRCGRPAACVWLR
jgi:hypothetical protein